MKQCRVTCPYRLNKELDENISHLFAAYFILMAKLLKIYTQTKYTCTKKINMAKTSPYLEKNNDKSKE